MVVNFALTKNLKRYSRSGLNRRRALYKLLKNKKTVNNNNPPFFFYFPHKLRSHFHTIFLIYVTSISFITRVIFFYYIACREEAR